MIIVGLLTLLIKFIAFYKETLIASNFGLSEILDTFLIAILVPSFIQSVFINSLKNIFIPNYILELKKNGNIQSLQTVILIITLSISIFSVLIAYLTTDLLLEYIYPGHSSSYYQLIKSQLYILLPCLFLWGFSSIIKGFLEISNKFLISTVSDIFPLLTIIFFIFYFKNELGHLVLTLGTLTGGVISLLFLIFFALKYKKLNLGRPTINENTRLMIRQLPPKVSSSFLTAMNNYIDQFFAAQLMVGSIAALNYGAKIPSFGITIIITALGNVLLPHFSTLVNNDLKGAYKQLFKTLKIVVGLGSVIALIIILTSDWIIEFLFEKNEFNHEDTLKVSLIQKILILHLPFYISTLVIVKFLTSINKNKFMAWVSLLNLIVNCILNYVLVKYFDVFGLAISTTSVLIISSFFYFGFTYKQYLKINK
ncbi:murein biosynthesis integral membrane protein MurJ [Formosa sp. A9]|uniref:murein biosynthesis integral membrane protein MurJ n=1 Tax=Formosa sp. A9 TaxID=3442641 RepID=UPI003EBAAB43